MGPARCKMEGGEGSRWAALVDPMAYPPPETPSLGEGKSGLTQALFELGMKETEVDEAPPNGMVVEEQTKPQPPPEMMDTQGDISQTGVTQGLGEMVIGDQELDTNQLVDLLTDLQGEGENPPEGMVVGDEFIPPPQEINTNQLVDLLTDLQEQELDDTSSEVSISLLDTSSQRMRLEMEFREELEEQGSLNDGGP